MHSIRQKSSLPRLHNNLNVLHHDVTWVLLESALTELAVNKLNNPTCFPASMCVFSCVACVCFINSRAVLRAPPGRKRDIHWSNETLFWAFTFTLFLWRPLCLHWFYSQPWKKSFQPASICWLLFFAAVVVDAKITAVFQGSVVRRKRRCCWVTMLSQNCPGNVGLPFGQPTVVRLFYRRVPRQQRPRWSPLVKAFLRDAGSDTKSLSSCQELIHVSLYMCSSFYKK